MGNKNVKKIKEPTPVKLVRVIFLLFSFFFIFVGIAAFPNILQCTNTFKGGADISDIIVSQILGLPFYIGFFSLIFKPYWAKLYCSTLLFFLILSMVGFSIFTIYKGADIKYLSPIFIPFSLTGWLFYSFFFGNAINEYFKRLRKDAPLNDEQGTRPQNGESSVEIDFYEVANDKSLPQTVLTSTVQRLGDILFVMFKRPVYIFSWVVLIGLSILFLISPIFPSLQPFHHFAKNPFINLSILFFPPSIILISCGVINANIAKRKGKSPWLGFFNGLIPIGVSLLIVLIFLWFCLAMGLSDWTSVL